MTPAYRYGVKTAAKVVGLKAKLLRLLSGPAGEHIIRLPIASGLGAGSGYAIGTVLGSRRPSQQAAVGATLPLVGTAGTLLSIPLRKKLIRALAR